MRKITFKIPAKINLSLDIVGVKDGYHELESLVTSVNLYDKITVERRNDCVVTLTNKGIIVDCAVTENNAYKTARLFMEKFGTNGVNITIEKSIPLASGLGGSSADIVGVIKGMKALYNIDEDMTELLNTLGSDTAYMYNGGYAVIKGRGEKIQKEEIDNRLYLILITENKSISARESYEKFDSINKFYPLSTENVVNCVKNNDFDGIKKYAKNDLYDGSVSIVKEMKDNILSLNAQGGIALMTGSGSGVFGIFRSRFLRDKAYAKLFPVYQSRIYKIHTL